jgi:hypothetical protein
MQCHKKERQISVFYYFVFSYHDLLLSLIQTIVELMMEVIALSSNTTLKSFNENLAYISGCKINLPNLYICYDEFPNNRISYVLIQIDVLLKVTISVVWIGNLIYCTLTYKTHIAIANSRTLIYLHRLSPCIGFSSESVLTFHVQSLLAGGCLTTLLTAVSRPSRNLSCSSLYILDTGGTENTAFSSSHIFACMFLAAITWQRLMLTEPLHSNGRCMGAYLAVFS